MLLLYKFRILFGTPRVLYFFRSLSTHWQKIYFLTPPTRETPQKMLFYSAAIQHSFNGGSLVVAALLLYFFHSPPFQHALTPRRETGARERSQLTLRRARVEIFWKCFFAEKMYDTRSTHPHLFLSRLSLRWMLKKNIKSPLKYNSPLFHITSNIDKRAYTQQPIQQSTNTNIDGEKIRWEILIIIPYITVFFSSSMYLIQHYWAEQQRKALFEQGEQAHHQFKAITLVFLTHTLPPTIISHHHRWKTEKKSQDARMPGGAAVWGELRMRVCVKRVRVGFWTEVGLEERRKTCEVHPSPPHTPQRRVRSRSRSIINYYTIFFLTRSEAPSVGVTFDMLSQIRTEGDE